MRFKSSGEVKIENYMKSRKINFYPQKKFVDCRLKNFLSFDFYVYSEPNFLIEFQGEQHFKPISFYGGSKTYWNQRQRDDIKKEYAKSNNIPLLEIGYWDDNNIEMILDKWFEFISTGDEISCYNFYEYLHNDKEKFNPKLYYCDVCNKIFDYEYLIDHKIKHEESNKSSILLIEKRKMDDFSFFLNDLYIQLNKFNKKMDDYIYDEDDEKIYKILKDKLEIILRFFWDSKKCESYLNIVKYDKKIGPHFNLILVELEIKIIHTIIRNHINYKLNKYSVFIIEDKKFYNLLDGIKNIINLLIPENISKNFSDILKN